MYFTADIEIKSYQSHHALLSHASWTLWGDASAAQDLPFWIYRIDLRESVSGFSAHRLGRMQQGPLRQSDQLPVRIQNAGVGELLVETGNAQHARTVSRSPSSSFHFISIPFQQVDHVHVS